MQVNTIHGASDKVMAGNALGAVARWARSEPWLLSALCLFILASGILIVWSKGIPFVFDGNEAFSSIVHALNMYRFGFDESIGLTDEAYGPDPIAHPFVYTHQGNFPRVFAYILVFLGMDSIVSQVIATTLIVGCASIYFCFRFFERWVGARAAFLITVVFITDYLMLLQWNVVTYRVWHMFFFFGAFYIVDRFSVARKVGWWSATTVVFYLSLFYFEFVFATMTAVAAGLYTLFVTAPRIRRMALIVALQLTGAFGAIFLLIGQNILYLGLDAFLTDAGLTFKARNHAPSGSDFQDLLKEFYQTHNIVFWFNLVDKSSARWPSNIIRDIATFNLGVLPPVLYLAPFMTALGLFVASLRTGRSRRGWGWILVRMVVAVTSLMLLALIAYKGSDTNHTFMRYSTEYLVSMALLAVVAIWSLIGVLTSDKLWCHDLAFTTNRGILRIALLVIALIFLAIALHSARIIVTGHSYNPNGAGFALLAQLVPLIAVFTLIVGAVFPRPLSFIHTVANSTLGLQVLLGVVFGLLSVCLLLLAVGLGTRQQLVLNAIFILLPLFGAALAKAGAVAQFMREGDGVSPQTIFRVLAFGVAVPGAGITAFLLLRTYSSQTIGPYPVSAAWLIATIGWGSIVLFVAPFLSSARIAWVFENPVPSIAILLFGPIVATMFLVARYLLVPIFGITAIYPVSFALVALLIGMTALHWGHQWWYRASGSGARHHTTAVVRKVFAILSFAAVVSAFAGALVCMQFAANSLSLGTQQVDPQWGALTGVFAAVVFVLGIVEVYKARADIAATASTTVLFVGIALAAYNTGTLFPIHHMPLWNELSGWDVGIEEYYIFLATACYLTLSLSLATRHRIGREKPAHLRRLLWFVIASIVGYLFTVFLTPGYVRTGFLERYVPFTVFLVNSVVAIGVYAAVRSVISMIKDARSQGGRVVQLLPVRAAGVAAVSVVVGWCFIWVHANLVATQLAPPDRFSFMHKLAEAPYAGRSAVVNTYAAPVSIMTGEWAYFDTRFQNAEVVDTEMSTTFAYDHNYLWFADKYDEKYLFPDYFICMMPTNLNQILQRLQGYPIPNCSKINIVDRAAKLAPIEQDSGPSVELVEIDERPDPAWAIVGLDWTVPPRLEKLEEGGFHFVGLTALPSEERAEWIVPNYLIAGTDNWADSEVTVYYSDYGCSNVQVKSLRADLHIEQPEKGARLPVDRGKGRSVLVGVRTWTEGRNGRLYFSQALDLETGRRCDVVADPAFDVIGLPDGTSALTWAAVPGMTRYEVRFQYRPVGGDAEWPEAWTHFGWFQIPQPQFKLVHMLSGYQYRFRLIPCQDDLCMPPYNAKSIFEPKEEPK